MIIFKTLKITGFGSIVEPFSYKLNKIGLNLISGHNGAGKSTIFNALFWCIYGKTLKEKSSIETWEHLRPKGYKGAEVSFTFEKGGKLIEIYRSSKGRGKLEMKIEGTLFTNYKTKIELQKAIEDHLGLSFKLAKNSIIFGQRLTRLMSETGTEQNKIFEEAFEVEFINEARKLVDENLIKLVEDINKKEPEVKYLKANIANLKESYLENKKIVKTFKERKANRLSQIKEEIAELKEKLKEVDKIEAKFEKLSYSKVPLEAKQEELEEKLKGYNELEKEEFRAQMEISKQEGILSDLQKEHKHLIKEYTNPKKICSECKQEIKSQKENKKLIKEKIQKLLPRIKEQSKVIEKVKNKHKTIASSITKLSNDKNSLEEVKNKLDKLNSKINNLPKIDVEYIKTQIHKYQKTYKDVKKEKLQIDIKPQLKKLKEKREELKPLKSELKKLTKEYTLHKWLLSDPFSNKGMKAYIFNEMLNQVNDRLVFYSKYIGFKVEFIKDMESSNKTLNAIVIKGEDIVMYNDLSGGQTQLVDLAIAFSIHDIVSNKVECNVLLMDEVFENLDKENIQIVNELISLKTKDKAVHLMTHNEQFNYQNSFNTELMLNTQGWTCKI